MLSEFIEAASHVTGIVAFARVDVASEVQLAEEFGVDGRSKVVGFGTRKCFSYDDVIKRDALLDWMREKFHLDNPFLRGMSEAKYEHEDPQPFVDVLQNSAIVIVNAPLAIHETGMKRLFLFGNNENFEALFPLYNSTAAAYIDNVTLLYVNTSLEKEAKHILDAYGLEYATPLILAVGHGEKHILDDINPDTLKVFVEEFLAGDLLKKALSDATHRIESDENREAGRHTRQPPVGLDEYKKSLMQQASETSDANENATRDVQRQHRLEVDGREYNYAAASHGAKVLSANKEAKGASNILDKDDEKYLRNPCSAEDKFVVIELSEETLVDTIVIGNHEFYSANLKEFELLGSLKYPTEEWNYLAKFEAENARHAQNFTLPKADWVKYLKVKMLSHHGSEFFCTLSTIQIYGVDAIERMLEGWIGKNSEESPSTANVPPVAAMQQTEMSSSGDKAGPEKNASKTFTGEVLVQGSRSNTDSVIKILMQKVKSLELDQAVFENYLEALSSDYKVLFTDMDQELADVSGQLRELSKTVEALQGYIRDMDDRWKSESRNLDYKLLSYIEAEAAALKIQKEQIKRMEDRELVALSVALFILAWHLVCYLLSLCSKRAFFSSSVFLVILFVVILVLST